MQPFRRGSPECRETVCPSPRLKPFHHHVENVVEQGAAAGFGAGEAEEPAVRAFLSPDGLALLGGRRAGGGAFGVFGFAGLGQGGAGTLGGSSSGLRLS